MQPIFRRFLPNHFSVRHVALDSALILSALYLSLWLRLGDERLGDHLSSLNQLAGGFLAIRLVLFLAFGVYESLWRYISTYDATRLMLAVMASTPVMVSLTYLLPSFGYLPRSFFIIDMFVCPALLMGVRLLRRRLFERQTRAQKSRLSLGKLLIYGAGQNGRLLAQRLLNDPQRDTDLLGFIDDDPQKREKMIQGLPILGRHAELENILHRSGCTDLVMAITSPPTELMRELVLLGRKYAVRVQRIAHFDATQILSRTEAVYRQVELKDLLSRPTSEVDLPSVKNLLQGKVVLVTGAGGSIGSELARQISRFTPSKLLLLDHAEFNLYEIDTELRPATENFSSVVPLLIDIKDEHSLRHAFAKWRPEVVFHAAAYKHVHLVEANIASAVLNNVQGTQNLLNLCEEYEVERFVMISSDKAVNPVGAMGATKRVCELLTSLNGLRRGRRYSSVRFGNVLGSSGSLIPLLRKQIESGGPVTLTHPEMTRYFMLIPEAVSLVLMSATLSQPGDVNVLKMGEPIRILDLAQSLMALMGKADKEIAIAFTGVRPGEKMYEELYLTGNELATRHTDILTVPGGDLNLLGSTHEHAHREISVQVQDLVHMAKNSDPHLLEFLRKIVNPSATASRTKTTHSSTIG